MEVAVEVLYRKQTAFASIILTIMHNQVENGIGSIRIYGIFFTLIIKNENISNDIFLSNYT